MRKEREGYKVNGVESLMTYKKKYEEIGKKEESKVCETMILIKFTLVSAGEQYHKERLGGKRGKWSREFDDFKIS